ncbi:MAG: zinc ribbon domain-containing protein [Bacillota bacterium]|jgi:RNA polymerase subunit RPABC4/transcription elongation factor Spt4|nr:zinc ribbon domain-containing protein [Bacillota bacterium]HPZ22538.1 zinc ribbon domain-containing protein [Bacillota bacterium]HQD20151.1 zinc ribbon domain-containing protein [Bacillota bacterium]
MVFIYRIREMFEGWFTGLTIAGIMGFFALLAIALAVAVPLVIGIFVWRDAERRGLNRAWALAAALIPNFLGLIAYLLVASQHKPKIHCPGCNTAVESGVNNCPSCGHRFALANCPKCNRAVSPGWKVCPECGQQLSE